VLIARGGALERARGLDLGADDVVSFLFETVEFAAKIRTRFASGIRKESSRPCSSTPFCRNNSSMSSWNR
jgi:DNA-binding response OmpR family regulator